MPPTTQKQSQLPLDLENLPAPPRLKLVIGKSKKSQTKHGKRPLPAPESEPEAPEPNYTTIHDYASAPVKKGKLPSKEKELRFMLTLLVVFEKK